MPCVLAVFLRLWSNNILDSGSACEFVETRQQLSNLCELVKQFCESISPKSTALSVGEDVRTPKALDEVETLLVEDLMLLAEAAVKMGVAGPLAHVLRALQSCDSSEQIRPSVSSHAENGEGEQVGEGGAMQEYRTLLKSSKDDSVTNRNFSRVKLYLMVSLLLWAASYSGCVAYVIEEISSVFIFIVEEEMRCAEVQKEQAVSTSSIVSDNIKTEDLFRAVVFTLMFCFFSWSCNVLYQSTEAAQKCSAARKHQSRPNAFIALLKDVGQHLDEVWNLKRKLKGTDHTRFDTDAPEVVCSIASPSQFSDDSKERDVTSRTSNASSSRAISPIFFKGSSGADALDKIVLESSSKRAPSTRSHTLKELNGNSSSTSSHWALYSTPMSRSLTRPPESRRGSQFSPDPLHGSPEPLPLAPPAESSQWTSTASATGPHLASHPPTCSSKPPLPLRPANANKSKCAVPGTLPENYNIEGVLRGSGASALSHEGTMFEADAGGQSTGQPSPYLCPRRPRLSSLSAVEEFRPQGIRQYLRHSEDPDRNSSLGILRKMQRKQSSSNNNNEVLFPSTLSTIDKE